MTKVQKISKSLTPFAGVFYVNDVLQGDVQKRCRDLIIQICNTENVTILKGVLSKDHVDTSLQLQFLLTGHS